MADLIFWDFEKEPILTGKLINCIKSFGRFKKPVFVFKVENKSYSIWGTAIIIKLLYNEKFGDDFRITYLGKTLTKQSRYPVKLFNVEKI